MPIEVVIGRPRPHEYDSVRDLIEIVATETFRDLFAPNPVPLEFKDEDRGPALRRLDMQKIKDYRKTRFDAKTIVAADKVFRSLASVKVSYGGLDVSLENEKWSFNSLEEFLAVMDQGTFYFRVSMYDGSRSLTVHELFSGVEQVTVAAPTRDEIESVFAVFDNQMGRFSLY